MPKEIPVITPTLTWDNRQLANDECVAILRHSGYSVGDPVTAPRHIAVLEALVSIHPDSEDKSGTGIDHFFIGSNKRAAGTTVSSDSIGIWIRWSDGKQTDFSFLEAIYPSNQERKVSDALREAISDYKFEYKDSRFATGTAISDLSGAKFSNRSEAVVFYDSPHFSQLAFRFAESEGGWDAIGLGGKQAFIGDDLADSDVRERWRSFYRQHARPGLATKSENARRPKKIDKAAWSPSL